MVAQSLDAEGLSVLVDVRATVRHLVLTLEQASQEAGLTEPQQHTLLCVAYGEAVGEEVTATTLREHLATDKNTVADIVRRLEAHGLLQRERRGRRIILTFTPAGRERFITSLGSIGRALADPAASHATTRLQRQLDHYLAIYRALAAPVHPARPHPPAGNGAN
jgi:DNA-binding MarR family transcriptional regulator